MSDRIDWTTANQQALGRQLDRVRRLLEARVEGRAPEADEPAGAAPDDDDSFGLNSVCRMFGLSAFERDIVILCAGIELDARFAPLVAGAHGDPALRVPTFGLALGILPEAHWSALTPDAPLRAWRLIELAGPEITTAPLRLDERVLHYLTGISHTDERLQGIVELLPDVAYGTFVHDTSVAAIASRIEELPGGAVAQITGADDEVRLAIATRVCAALGVRPMRLRASDVPATAPERFALARLVTRETWLAGALPVIDVSHDVDDSRVAAFADWIDAPLLVCAADPLRTLAGKSTVFDLARSRTVDRLVTWREALGPLASSLNGTLDAVCSQFDLGDAAIRAVAAHVRSADGAAKDAAAVLWDHCQSVTRPRLDALAERIDAIAGWDDIVLPETQLRVLRTLAANVRQRHRVYEEWGFARKSARGLGTTALFAGASGTGKTMAAEVIARELRLDLYRVDLAGVVSKYIGETEKNLKRLFDAAEGSGAILLFDEADALFGKRSDVKDSHDRYANIEVSYLLQRMEAYRGLAILTTNQKQALDSAFLRRIRFIVQFPFPDQEHRAAIWRGVFPVTTPTIGLDYGRLAQLNLPGGHIRNIALAGAFLAAEHGEPISMQHLAEAARSEYGKLERPLGDAETRGW